MHGPNCRRKDGVDPSLVEQESDGESRRAWPTADSTSAGLHNLPLSINLQTLNCICYELAHIM
ncbi:MAG: hypothetical protein ACJ8AH_27485, partial [Stellaceae bacterium]